MRAARLLSPSPTDAPFWGGVTSPTPPTDESSPSQAPLLTLSDYEAAAAALVLSRPRGAATWGYYAGGAADEETLREAPASFSALRLRPRTLVDVRGVDTRSSLLGDGRVGAPFGIAPTAFHALLHSDGERAVARAARAEDVPYCVSSFATTALEGVAAEAGPGALLWFQLYAMADRDVTRALVERASACGGFSALVLTVDRPVLGRRETDTRTGFDVPWHVHKDPNGLCGGSNTGGGSGGQSALYASIASDLTWDDVAWLRTITSLPIVVKGVLAEADAAAAVRAGAAAVWVSTHGGRQLDSAVSSMAALPRVLAGVRAAEAEAAALAARSGAPRAARVEVYVDGGVRRGTDVVKALAMGADFVWMGRPPLWGLAVDGESGVRAVLRILRDEVRTAMALCGVTRVQALRGGAGAHLVATRAQLERESTDWLAGAGEGGGGARAGAGSLAIAAFALAVGVGIGLAISGRRR